MRPSGLAFIVGLKAEARLVDRAVVGGGGAAGARRAAAQAIEGGAGALVSFGLAGGLAPGLDAGALLVPRCVVAGGKRYQADTALSAALGGFSAEAMLAGEAVVTRAADKARLWQASGAEAVDLESGAVAEAAVAAGLPFAVLRAVCDPAWRTLPPAAAGALDAAGAIGLGRILASLARDPGQLAALVALGRDAARARRALARRLASIHRSGALAAWQDQPGSPPVSSGTQ